VVVPTSSLYIEALVGTHPLLEDFKLIHRALDAGINCLDTARAYGTSEEVIGEALRGLSPKPIIVSKVLLSDNAFDTVGSLRREIKESVEKSLKALGVDTLDVVLTHNTSLRSLNSQEVIDTLRECQQNGKIRFFGSSCYADEIPRAVLSHPANRVMQVPFNLLDQKMNEGVFQDAVAGGVGIFARSIYLRGVLTPQVHTLPDRLAPLKQASLRALDLVGQEVKTLAELAIRFCLSFSGISSVLIGVKTVEELESNLTDAAKGSLSGDALTQLRQISFGRNPIVDTRTWQDLII
jgi:aryl-alcohol dehydrogenase-like predicted oxidoreductase